MATMIKDRKGFYGEFTSYLPNKVESNHPQKHLIIELLCIATYEAEKTGLIEDVLRVIAEIMFQQNQECVVCKGYEDWMWHASDFVFCTKCDHNIMLRIYRTQYNEFPAVRIKEANIVAIVVRTGGSSSYDRINIVPRMFKGLEVLCQQWEKVYITIDYIGQIVCKRIGDKWEKIFLNPEQMDNGMVIPFM